MTELPENPYSNQFLALTSIWQGAKITFGDGTSGAQLTEAAEFAYNRAQQDMLKAGYKKPPSYIDTEKYYRE